MSCIVVFSSSRKSIANILTGFLTSGSSSSISLILAGLLGHCSADPQRNSGACSHRLLLINLSAQRPMDVSSAGLQLESMYCHCQGELTSRMAATRFETNV